ncbi:MAG TPA: apolipoprotein N-acyltransferase, partial [Kineosporiaceae bacterium]|nr:apolipoprotein N-acyltransferase [Kineosporiaceae bacterium]
ALIGLTFGLAFMLTDLHWSGVYVGVLPWVALSTLEAGYLAAMAALLPLAWRAPGGRAGTVLGVAGLWVAQEGLRSRTPFGGFPWSRVAFSQADAPTLGYAAIGGAPLVTAAAAAIGGCLALAVVAAIDLSPRRIRLRRAGAVLLAAAALLAGGAAVPRPAGSDRTAQVAAVQGNVPRAGLEFNAERRAVLDNHVDATERLAAQVSARRAPQPDLVVWPENSSDIDPLRNPDAAARITEAANTVGVPVLVGAVLDGPADHVSNAAIVWGPTGSAAPGPGARYVKRHPAPFAEYIPYRSFFRHFSDKVDMVVRDFASGDHVGVMSMGPARLGDVICFEVAYDDLVRDPVLAGADLLAVQTNNATFGYTDESVQQLAMSRLRAVESGRSVVHISTVGVSALIAPDGRMVATSGHFTRQVLQARLPLRTQLTVATRVGAAPEALIGIVGVLLAGLAALSGARARRRAIPGTIATTDATGGTPAADDDARGDTREAGQESS